MSRRFGGAGIRRLVRSMASTATPFDPLADPDYVGIWLSPDATDNGSTLTVPEYNGGTSFAITSAGRPTISATGLDGITQSINTTASTADLAATISTLTGATSLTVYVMAAMGTLTTTGTPFYVGASGNQRFTYRWALSGGGGMYAVRDNGGAGTQTATTTTQGREFFYPSVTAFRWDMAQSPESFQWIRDGRVRSTTVAGLADTTGGLFNGACIWGAVFGGTNRFRGHLGALAIVRRAHTDAEVDLWTTWLRAQLGFSSAKEWMWCGDSLPANTSGKAQWRSAIQDLYDARGDNVRFYRTVGPLAAASVAFDEDRCFAVGGVSIGGLKDLIPVYKIGDVYQPDFGYVQVGTNNLGVDTSAEMAAQYEELITTLAAASPRTHWICALLPSGSAVQRAEFNGLLPAVVSTLQGNGVSCSLDSTFADIPDVVFGDGLHPDAGEETKIAPPMEAMTRSYCGVAA